MTNSAQDLLAHLDAAVVAFDSDGVITHWNPAAEQRLGWSEAEAVGRRAEERLVTPDDAATVAVIRAALEREGRWSGTLALRRKDGSRAAVFARCRTLPASSGRPPGYVGVLTAEEELPRRESGAEQRAERRATQQAAIAQLGKRALLEPDLGTLFEEAIAVALDAFAADLGGVVELCEDGRLHMVAGPDKGDRIPAGPRSLTGHTLTYEQPAVVDDWERETRFEPAPVVREAGARSGVSVVVPGRHAPFGALAIHAKAPRRFDAEDVDALQGLANVLADAIERARSEDRLAHQALHDPVTGLPNRTLLIDRLRHALARGERDDRRVAVLFVDVDHFKLVNDTLGHDAGDELLAGLAPRLAEALRPSDTVARFGADEFAIVCEDLDSERDAIAIAERVAGACTHPLLVAAQDHFVSVSIGISLGPEAGAGPDELIRNAHSAVYRAKERGRGRYELYDEEMRSRYLARLGIESELRPALERGQLRLDYQPVVAVDDGAVLGVEALLRWEHPERGLVGPDEFIPVAEESGLIVPIGRWVLEQACRQVRAWDVRAGEQPLTVGVNVSARQVASGGLVATVAQVLDETGMEPARVALEITESVLMEDEDAALATLRGLKELGVALFLDDFGTGYSSLGYLKRFPIDALKIDRSFVSELGQDVEDSIIVAAVMSMARALGLTVVAEGVETAQQLRHLRSLDCARAQGWFFARPMRADDLGGLLSSAGGPLRLLPGDGAAALTAN